MGVDKVTPPTSSVLEEHNMEVFHRSMGGVKAWKTIDHRGPGEEEHTDGDKRRRRREVLPTIAFSSTFTAVSWYGSCATVYNLLR